MAEALKKPAEFSQYRRKSGRAVTKAHRTIETATADALTNAGHLAPNKVAKAVRYATDAFDDLAADTLERATRDPEALDKALKDAIRKTAKSSEPKRKRKPLELGETIQLTPLPAAESRKPFAGDPETVGEENDLYATLSTTQAADQLDISRPTAIDWIKSGKLIGIQGAKRGWRIPKAQIRRGRLAPALQDVSQHFDDAEDAWHFLVTEQSVGDDFARPLDLLFRKKTDLVIGLAESYGRDFL